jgi:ribosomal protein S18 acetylase RimI-like enzyme
MSKLEIVRYGADRLRFGPWRGDPHVAQVVPSPSHVPSRAAVDGCLVELARLGYRGALTSALAEAEQAPFFEAGFVVHERLHLLRHRLGRLPEVPPLPRHTRLRRGLRLDRRRVLEVDGAAFDAFWRFDHRGLDEARSATPSSRFRVIVEGSVVGYAVTGRAGRLGYLQRLAVLPDRQGRGLGTALVVDALGWARRHGATAVLVNTQEANQGALSLYEHLGFEHEPTGLAVLERSLADVGDGR